MGFDNYLSGMPAPGEAMIPGMGGLEAAMNQNRQMAPQQQQPQQPRGPHGLGHILGLIGATLATARGRPAPYFEQLMQLKQEQKQQAQNAAFANYLGGLDPELVGLIQGGVPPAAAIQAYGLKHPEAKDPPGMIREWQERNKLPPEQRADYDKYVESRRFNPFGAPVVMGQGDTIEYPGGQGAPSGEVTATNPQTGERVRLNPESGQWEPMGGPTASPSGVFPGQ